MSSSSSVIEINKQKSSIVRDFSEIGRTGLKRSGGLVREEFLLILRGKTGIRVFKEMKDNDAVIGASLRAITQTIQAVNWFVDPSGDTNLELEAAQFVRENMIDMSHPWKTLISEITTMFPFGWAFLEVVNKIRKGDVVDHNRKSRFNDGLIGTRKIALRKQETLHEWIFDPLDDGIKGMIQIVENDFRVKTIPIERALLFRTEIDGNNPEGRSILRNAFRSWHIKKNLEELEAIGIERDLIGLPWIIPPEDFDIDAKENQSIIDFVDNLLFSLRRDEQSGVFLPPGWKITLLAGGGSGRRTFDMDRIITRWDKRISLSLLTQAMMLGLDRVGSFALSRSSIDDFFLTSVQGHLENIAEVFNNFWIPRLLRLNMKFVSLIEDGKQPRLIPGRVSGPTLRDVGNYIRDLSGAGIFFTDDDFKRQLRRIGQFDEHEEFSPRLISGEKISTSSSSSSSQPKQQGEPNASNQTNN